MSNTIDSSLFLASKKQEPRQTGRDILGKDDFLKILMTQLQNQDPLKPLEDKEFISQMATFSSLEQLSNMNTLMTEFITSQSSNQIATYSEMIGKDVEWHAFDETREEITSGSGLVASVLQKNGAYYLELEDGTEINAADVVRVSVHAPTSK